MIIALAPMEGLVDDVMREVLTRFGGIDWCVTEFIRVTDTLLPNRFYHRVAPELLAGAQTAAGVPVRLQLLGSDPICLADNAAKAASLGAPVIDLNFGCPAKTVNRHRGGAVLLQEPELLYQIVAEVRKATPAETLVTTKMRLGYADTSLALDCARALDAAGSAQIVVHARTKMDGYKPPAHWHWIARIKEAVKAPVVANGEVWTIADYHACRRESHCDDVMIGRGLVARPDLARQIVAEREGRSDGEVSWHAMLPVLLDFYRQVRASVEPKHAPGRLKQWVGYLRQGFDEADELFRQLRQQTDPDELERFLAYKIEGVSDTSSNHP
ncbi:tRNA dihydrouridine synthase [Parachitinimonas caeni]|uniref:tRNA-dihydrouridine(16) synthase n=1 Tax=Parachitinimonas caeni TaxID=3031301 RepID=A0ABT7E2S3_9NEIS|nr:tRNA-dihydrouridine synthase [Parachitinimonas caeni]MDK2126617.1 tRNA-dihydrouridine synthase [Parachitinimonas caeni]